MDELFKMYKKQHFDSTMHIIQFRKLINFCLDDWGEQILQGKVLNLGNRMGLLFIRMCKRNYDLYVIDKISSSKNKMDIYGCESCDEYIFPENNIGLCTRTGKNIYATICHKQPTILKGKNNEFGKPWVVPFTNSYYFALVWQKAFARTKNRRIYDFVTSPAMKKKIVKEENKELIYQNK